MSRRKEDISLIDLVARDCSEKIVDSIVTLSEFFIGEPHLVSNFNAEMWKNLSPALKIVLSEKYGYEAVAAWESNMMQKHQKVVSYGLEGSP